MSNGYPYIQFCPDKWLSGKVSALDLDGQGLYLHFCMAAWAGRGVFNICSTSVQLRFRKPAEWVETTVNAMIAVGILIPKGEQYGIKFIDEQISALDEIREKRSKAGKASAAARADSSSDKEEKSTVENRREEKSSVLESVQHESNTCSTHVEPKKKKKLPHGEFKNVKLTDDEYKKLVVIYGESDIDLAIETLDSYIEQKGKRYKSHYAVMKKTGWVFTEVRNQRGGTRNGSTNQGRNTHQQTPRSRTGDIDGPTVDTSSVPMF